VPTSEKDHDRIAAKMSAYYNSGTGSVHYKRKIHYYLKKYHTLTYEPCVGCNVRHYRIFTNSNFCIKCRNRRYRTKYRDVSIINALKNKIRKRLSEGQFASDLNLNFLKTRVENAFQQGNVKYIEFLSLVGVDARIYCARCDQYGYSYEHPPAPDSRLGISPRCNSCMKDSSGVLKSRLAAAAYRQPGREDSESTLDNRNSLMASLSTIVAAQEGRCFYTFVKMDMDSCASPLSPSIERLDRQKDYRQQGNSVAICRALNVGGVYNWTRKLTLQILFAKSVRPKHTRETISRCHLNYMVRSCRQRSKQRASNAHREQEHHELMEVSADIILGLFDQQNGRCYLSNLPLVFEKKHPFSVSVDRLDNTMGYVEGNICLVIARLNCSTKQPWSHETFTRFMAKVRLHKNKILEAEGFDPSDLKSTRGTQRFVRYLNNLLTI